MNPKDNEKISQLYDRTVRGCSLKDGFVICPECGQGLLITPALLEMSRVIENHVELHKTIYRSGSSLEVVKHLHIRLSLMWQVLDQRGI
jgi:hypothetical protein